MRDELKEKTNKIDEILDKYANADFCEAETIDCSYNTHQIKDQLYELMLEEVIGEDEEGETVQVPCPDGIPGCCVYHTETRMTERVRIRNILRAEQRAKLKVVFGK